MPTLFQTYDTAENRVTGTMLAVFERLSVALVERILQDALEASELKLVRFENQPRGRHAAAAGTVPDGRIHASFSYWIETKIVPHAIHDEVQLRGHLEKFDRRYDDERLFVITPDTIRPRVVSALQARENEQTRRLEWIRFDDLAQSIERVFALTEAGDSLNSVAIPTERERFLLREFLDFLFAERLIRQAVEDRVLLVPARTAAADYDRYGAYLCQPHRSFQPSMFLGFYVDNVIHQNVPKVLAIVNSVRWTDQGLAEAVEEYASANTPDGHLTASEVASRLTEMLRRMQEVEPDRVGQLNEVLLLTPKARLTIEEQLGAEVPNDLTSGGGRRVAFVQGQRYVQMSKLRSASATSDLVRHS